VDEALLVTACVLAALASVAAWRAHLSMERLLRELAAGRSRRPGARGPDEAVREGDGDRPGDAAVALGRRLDALEERLRDLLARVASDEARAVETPARGGGGASAAGSAGDRDRVRRHLISLGFEDVAFLPGRGPGGVLTVEARRDGIPVKGTARVGDEGKIELRLADSLRAFP
jgi:hypothetical protein